MATQEDYTKMQRDQYDYAAGFWTPEKRNPVVGTFDKHNAWNGYNNLWNDLAGDTTKMRVLDFGCGPGRNIVKYSDKFSQIDGVDISSINLEKAKQWIEHNHIDKKSELFLCNGSDLTCIKENNIYDVVMSTISLQHICCYSIRLSYFKHFYRVLKPSGYLTIQMGFGGKPDNKCVDYYEDRFDAGLTNGGCDVNISKEEEVIDMLKDLRFQSINTYITETGPGDCFKNWIFFNATK